MADVINHPGAAPKRVRQPKGAMSRDTWPANVQPIREPAPRVASPPSAFLVIGLLQALERAHSVAAVQGQPCEAVGMLAVDRELRGLLEHHRDRDMEVAANVYAAIAMLWSGTCGGSGRW